ncbi:unnamed protein product [Pipistrellus nathusii]|uniref:Hexosyltransferase n=1 Tax=Pipistrellus nathusii TaxID=59473 RepID=A0ABN9ZVA5_PIPNA
MASARLRWLSAALVALGALCLLLSMHGLPLLLGEPLVFRKEGRFLQLPALDCRREPPFLVLLVASAHDQLPARTAIRETWGAQRAVRGRRTETLFLLGTSPSPAAARAVAQEARRHRDIVQKDFVDAYLNLTLKTMMGIEWVHRFCPRAAFVMKTDSDMFVNVAYLVELLLRRNRTARFATGFLKLHELPIRERRNKWFVSRREYPWDRYPPFCSGTAYVLSGDVASQVYRVADRVPFLKLEDVFVGLCLAKLRIGLEELHSEQTFFPGGLSFSPCRFRRIVACHFVPPHKMLSYWKALEASPGEACPAE